MVRADFHFAQDPMRPAAKHVKVGSSGSPPHFPGNDRSVCPSKNFSVAHWGSLHDDFQRPDRLTRKPSDSKYSRPSLDTSGAQPLGGIKRIPLHSRRANTDPMSYEQSWSSSPGLRQSFDIGPAFDSHDSLPRKAKGVKTKVNIKPLLRKISRDGARPTSLDLSRSSLEYEGLGIYTNFEHERQQGDYLGNNTARRTASGLHNRSISETSQFSIARSPSVSKRSSYNFHPMRQAPSAYTPPLSQSYQTSSGESDGSENANPFPVERESTTLSRSNSFHPIQPPRLSLQTANDVPFSKSPGGPTSSVSGRHSFGYSRDHDGSTVDSLSPISRPSLDFVFRPKQRASTDPIARAATVQAARKAFEEKEAAKAQKFERHQMKAEERHIRRKEKQWWRNSADDQIERTDMDMGNADLESSISEKSSSPNVPDHDSPPLPAQTRTASWKSQSKDTWMLFVTWLRTRLFKLRRKLRKLQ